METKVCGKCGIEKSTSEFQIADSIRGYLRTYCKACDRDIAREYYRNNPRHAEAVRERSKAARKQPRVKKTPEEKRADHAAYMRQYLADHPEAREAAKARSKQWLAEHPETYQKRREYILQWHRDNPIPGDRKERNRRKSLYGVTEDDYRRMLAEQDEKCALCGTTDGGRKKPAYKWGIGTLSIDHCHKTNRVRGLLCHLCNSRLGAYEALLAAVSETRIKEYLSEPRSTPFRGSLAASVG